MYGQPGYHNKEQRSSDYNRHRGNVTYSVQDTITRYTAGTSSSFCLNCLLKRSTFVCEDSKRPILACIHWYLCLLQRVHRPDSCPCYTGAMDCCHSGPCPGSLTGLLLSDGLQVLENLPLDDPTPCSYPLPSSPLRAARSAVTTVYRPHPGPLTHPSVSLAGDGQDRWDSQARSEGWPYSYYSGLAPCHYFQLPPSAPPQSICHLH